MSPSALTHALMQSGETVQTIWEVFVSLPSVDWSIALPALGVLVCVCWSAHLYFLACYRRVQS